MPDLSGLGDLVLTVGGDISPLESALNEVPAIAQTAASQIQAAFDALPSATDPVVESMSKLGEATTEAGKEAAAAGDQITQMTTEVSAGATEAAGSIGQMPTALHDTSTAAHEAESSLGEFIKTGLELAGIVISLEAIKETLVGSLEAFGEFQRAGEALTIITKNSVLAADAMERIPAIADKLGVSIVSLENAQQRLALYGVDLQKIPDALTAIADASRAAHTDFDAAASAFERMDNTGKIMPRTLQALGLNMEDLAKAMDMEGASSKEVQQAFADLADASERAAVLVSAAEEKMGGAAAATANDVIGSWQQIKNTIHEAMVNIGESLAGIGGGTGLDILKNSIKGIETFVVSLIGYAQQAIDIIKGLYNISLATFVGLGKAAADAAHGDFAKAKDDIVGMASNIKTAFDDATSSMQIDWTKTGSIIDNIWAKASSGADALTKVASAHKDAAAAASEDATATTAAADAVKEFVGPIYQANQGIEMYSGAVQDATDHAATMVNGVEVFTGSVATMTDTVKDATTWVYNLDGAWKTAAQAASAAAQTMTTDLQDVANAAAEAGSAVETLGQQLDASMSGTPGGRGFSVSMQPGQVMSVPFRGNPDMSGTETAGGFGGGLFGPMFPNENITFGTPEQIIAYGRALSGANTSVASAAQALTTAATTQQDAAQAAYDAAKAAMVGSQTVSTSMTNAADSISASALAAADAANTAAFNNSALASTVQQTAAVVASVATIAAASTTLVSAAVVKLGPVLGFTPGGSNTFAPFSGPSVSLPNVGPGGANTMTMSQPFQGYYQPTVGGTGPSPVQLNVNGSQFVQQLMDEFIRNMQSQGIRLTRA